MSELHKFIFEGLPVRGALVRLDDAWVEILRRRGESETGVYPPAVQAMLGEMTAAGVLMQSSIKFNGSLILQVFGDGPVKLAVAEVQSDLGLRATASVKGEVAADAGLEAMVNVHGQGRCAVTLDPKERKPGQQPYQGVVPLSTSSESRVQSMAEALQLYMRQSEQLDTVLVLAADDKLAAGLLIQRMPLEGAGNLQGQDAPSEEELYEHYNRIATLASSLKREELLTLDADTILRRLFWEETLRRFEPQAGETGPHFSCSCSRARVGQMIKGLGEIEAKDILSEQDAIDVHCEFCGAGYRFDAVDAAQLFKTEGEPPPSSASIQ